MTTRKTRWTGRVEVRPTVLNSLVAMLGVDQAVAYLQLVGASQCGRKSLTDDALSLVEAGVTITPNLAKMVEIGLVIWAGEKVDEGKGEGGTIGGMAIGESSVISKVTARTNLADSRVSPEDKSSVETLVNGGDSDFALESPVKHPPKCPYDKIIRLYHLNCPTLPHVKSVPEHRKTAIRSRWRDNPKYQDLTQWERFFKYVDGNDFLRGDRTDFRANLDWLMRPRNFVKVIEGNYDRE